MFVYIRIEISKKKNIKNWKLKIKNYKIIIKLKLSVFLKQLRALNINIKIKKYIYVWCSDK